MFSLIIAIVAILLVVLIAVATLYYGGSAATSLSAKAAGAALVSQATQIDAAGATAEAQGDAWPAGAPSFTQPFIAAMPVPPKGAYVEGTPSAADWQYYAADGSHNFVLRNKINKGACLALNQSAGLVGIPAAWDGVTSSQCFGPGVAATSGQLAYTFFYVARGTTAVQNQVALNQSITEANASNPATPATAGYPRLCPDGSSVNSGVCPNSSGSSAGAPDNAAVAVTPPPPNLIFRDTFQGTGTLATHTGEIGASWSFASSGNAQLSNFPLNGAGSLSNPDGWSSYLKPSGVPTANSEYYIEFDVTYTGSSTQPWYGTFDVFTTVDGTTLGGQNGQYEFYWYLNNAVAGQMEIDTNKGNGYLGYGMADGMPSNIKQTFRMELRHGYKRVLINGVEISNTPDPSPVNPGGLAFNFGQDLLISRAEMGYLN